MKREEVIDLIQSHRMLIGQGTIDAVCSVANEVERDWRKSKGLTLEIRRAVRHRLD